jgi:outer membrane murein-binding lipoprotein Lpp
MTRTKLKFGAILAIGLAISVSGIALFVQPGCATPEQVQQWKTSSQSLATEMDQVQNDLALVTDPELRATLEAKWELMRTQVNRLNDKIQSAESGWDFAEILVAAGAGAFPPLSVLYPVLRALRRRTEERDHTYEAVKAGGGPTNPGAARDKMTEVPRAYAAFKKWARKNGNT